MSAATGIVHLAPVTSCPRCDDAGLLACSCEFDALWQMARWPELGTIGDQLRRRREAALRSPRLASGLRDPISGRAA